MKKTDDKKSKLDDKKNAEEIKKQIDRLNVCPYCQNFVEFIWVHGHYQCPKCKNIVMGCCGDE
jgi:hypothetical protein